MMKKRNISWGTVTGNIIDTMLKMDQNCQNLQNSQKIKIYIYLED